MLSSEVSSETLEREKVPNSEATSLPHHDGSEHLHQAFLGQGAARAVGLGGSAMASHTLW
jgi:hypothetical protein